MNGSVGWSDAGIFIPYRFWKIFDDPSLLEEHYEGMRAFAHFMIRRCGAWGGPLAPRVKIGKDLRKYLVNAGQSYGEWAEPADVATWTFLDMSKPRPEESTAYTAHVLGLMAEIAAHMGRSDDEKLFAEYRDGCTRAYQALCEQPGFELDTDRQARLVRPLAFDLLSPSQREYAQQRLLTALDNYGWRLGTGFLSTPLILGVLADIDIEAAYRLLENEEIPGWLAMPKSGTTTVWESWEGPNKPDGADSLNHYSKGAVCEWLFSTMCGIRVAGERTFHIAPRPGSSLTHASAIYDSTWGRVASSWRRDGDATTFIIEVPPNCTASVTLPDGQVHSLCAGTHEFQAVDRTVKTN